MGLKLSQNTVLLFVLCWRFIGYKKNKVTPFILLDHFKGSSVSDLLFLLQSKAELSDL